MSLIKRGTKLTKQDLYGIASFFRIVKNYVKMKRIQTEKHEPESNNRAAAV